MEKLSVVKHINNKLEMHKYVCCILKERNGVHVVKIEREAYIMNFTQVCCTCPSYEILKI